MDDETLDLFTKISGSIVKDNWKKALDSLFVTLRKNFVFDNLAIYLAEATGIMPEVIYARATGRGRSKEAEVSWGEEIANQVISTGKIVVSNPSGEASADRFATPYLIGIPLNLKIGDGALVFVRFGGPEYTAEQMPLVTLAAVQSARVFERRSLEENLAKIELAGHRAQLQDDFVATISHELRTPLGFVKGYTTSLLRSDTVWDPATQREFLTIIDEESDHLMVLIDHILDSARLRSGNMPMDFQPLRLDALLRDVVMRIQDRNKTLEVVLNLVPAQPIQADAVRLTQVFDNLFDNAIKYAPESGITISLKATAEKQIVTFADRGPGIPEEHLPFLFERFYRVPSHPSRRGTGLGLFICQQIVQAHHGQILAKTSPGKGTAFVIELPVRQKGIP
ncbi:MAG: HAMP domain-containing sensor histidine kinase [Chloroflexota bacterium]